MATITTRLGMWNDVFGRARPRVRGVADVLRKVIRTDMPDAVAVSGKGDRAVSGGVGEEDASASPRCVQPRGARVKPDLRHGTSPTDPDGVLEGAGKALRHVKGRDDENARSGPVAALVAAAREERASWLSGR